MPPLEIISADSKRILTPTGTPHSSVPQTSNNSAFQSALAPNQTQVTALILPKDKESDHM